MRAARRSPPKVLGSLWNVLHITEMEMRNGIKLEDNPPRYASPTQTRSTLLTADRNVEKALRSAHTQFKCRSSPHIPIRRSTTRTLVMK